MGPTCPIQGVLLAEKCGFPSIPPVAEIGLGTIMTASYQSDAVNPQAFPFGFNSMMHSQVAGCRAQLAPSAMTDLLRDFMLMLAESVPAEWFLSRLEFFGGTY